MDRGCDLTDCEIVFWPDRQPLLPTMFQALEGGIQSVSSSFSPKSLYHFQNADEQLLLSWLHMARDIKRNTSIFKMYLLYADVKESQK